MENQYDYDFFVIGGGSGGMRAAKSAAMLNAKVGLADFVKPSTQNNTWGLGGTCVNVGCIPKKLYHYNGILSEILKNTKENWDFSNVQQNYEKLQQIVNLKIKSLNWGAKLSLNDHNIKYYNKLAKIIDNNTIELTNNKDSPVKITAKYILIATGGRPFIPNIPGLLENAITSDDIFFLKSVPKSVLVIGGGYIALECAGFLAAFGVKVDVLIRSEVLRSFDKDCALKVKEYMENVSKINFIYGNLLELNNQNNLNNCTIKTNEGEIITNVYEKVMVATGRYSDLKNIGLENLIGINYNPEKKLIRDKIYSINDTQNVFAIGDIAAGGLELTPVAMREGELLASYLFGGLNCFKSINYKNVCTTIFTPLEYSCVGYSEEEAIKNYKKENVAVFDMKFSPLEWTFNKHDVGDICYCKIITVKEGYKNIEIDYNNQFEVIKNYSSSPVIGIHYVGPNAGEIMQGYGVAINKDLTFYDLISTIGIHPTTSENIVNIRLLKNIEAEEGGC